MAGKHKLIVTGLLMCISVPLALSFSGKNMLYVAADFRTAAEPGRVAFPRVIIDFSMQYTDSPCSKKKKMMMVHDENKDLMSVR